MYLELSIVEETIALPLAFTKTFLDKKRNLIYNKDFDC